MRMGQGVRTGLGHGASLVSYRHNFLVCNLEFQDGCHLPLLKIAQNMKMTISQ